MSCFHLSRQFKNRKDQLIEVHIQRHFNYIQIKVVKCDSFSKSIFLIPLILLLTVLYCLHFNLEELPFWVSLSVGLSAALFVYFLLCNFIVTEESILLIRSIHGVQYNHRNLLGKVTSKFIDSTNIIINEAVSMSKIESYLAVLECKSNELTSSQQIHPLFNYLMPRTGCLKLISSHLTDFLTDNTQQAS